MAPKSFVIAFAGILGGVSAALMPDYSKIQLAARWDTSLCAANPGVAIPDSDTFTLPLEGSRQDLCWGLCVGEQSSCTTMGQICYNFQGANLIFTYEAVPGYTYTEADIWLGLTSPTGTPTSQYTTSNGYCTISSDSTTVGCQIPYSSITSNSNVLAGMCPNGDSQGLTFYLYTNAQLNNVNGTGSVPAEGRLACADYPTCSSYLSYTYWELAYRCTDCPTVSSSSSSTPSSSSSTSSTTPSSSSTPSSVTPSTSKPCTTIKTFSQPSKSPCPSTSHKAPSSSSTPCKTSPHAPPTPSSTITYCPFGTAFGYETSCSQTFESLYQCPETCQRWGWYNGFNNQQISKGISGPLYVGAGGNDLSKSIDVGSWSAQKHSDGKVYVYLSVAGGYSLGSVNVDVGCTPISSCNPGGFDYSNNGLPSGTTSFTTPGLTLPGCGNGGQNYIIVQAGINSAHTVWGWPDQPGSYNCAEPVCQ